MMGRIEEEKQEQETEGKMEGETLTSVGLKQSTSKSCERIKGSLSRRLCLVCPFLFIYLFLKSYLDPGSPFNIAGHIQQLVHIDLQLWDGLLLDGTREEENQKSAHTQKEILTPPHTPPNVSILSPCGRVM